MLKIKGKAYTFDDLLLIPHYSSVLPKHVRIDVPIFPKYGITLKIPILSAPMDTVTESRLAIALAREGGIGVIHKKMTIQRQAAEVSKVKRSEAGMVIDPITLRRDNKLAEAMELMKKFSISSIPITTEEGKLVGIITSRDLRFVQNPDEEIMTLMTEEVRTIQEGADVDQVKKVLHDYRIEKVPVVDGKGFLKGLYTYEDIRKVELYPDACKDEKGSLRVAASVGVADDLLERALALIKAGVDFLVVESSHAHSEGVIKAVKLLKEKFPQFPLMAGNIGTAKAATDLIDAGADALKVGLGPGSICTTRVISGAGIPQMTAIDNVVQVARESGIPVIADGGIKFSGDITKALAAGAAAVMIGKLFSGTDESPGDIVIFEGVKHKLYRGMGSQSALREGTGDRYFQEHIKDPKKFIPEGVEGRVRYTGSVAELAYLLVGGLRTGMGLCGAPDIETLQETAEFYEVTGAGARESHPHGVLITEEPANYLIGKGE